MKVELNKEDTDYQILLKPKDFNTLNSIGLPE